MSKNLSIFLLSLLLLSPAALSEELQPRCTTSDSPQSCFKKYFGDGVADDQKVTDRQELAEEMTKNTKDVAEETLSRNPADLARTLQSGSDTGGQSASSTAKDFLSALSFLGLVNTEEGSEDGTLKIDFNRLLPKGVQRLGGQLSGVLNTEPKLFDGLAPELPEDRREEIVNRLEKKSSGLTDLSLTLSINFLGSHLGRDLKAWRLQYAALLRDAIDRTLADPPPSPSLGGIIAEIGNSHPLKQGDEDVSFDEIAERRGTYYDNAAGLVEKFEALARSESSFDKRLQEVSVAAHHEKFPALLNNQPQLFASFSWKVRDDLVGPDERSLKLTWEHPLAPSLNKLRKECPSSVERFADCYSDFFNGKEEALQRSQRISASVEYKDVRDFTVDLPEDGFSKTFEGGHKLVGSFGWGRQLEADEDGNALSKVDLMVSYEDISDPNPDLRVDERWLATLTFTRKIRGVDVPLAIVYSNKSEFLAMQDLDEMISAHVGLRFRLDTKKD